MRRRPSDVFAAEVRRRRHELQLTQQKLADGTGLSRTEIVMLERGEGSPRLDTIVSIAERFGSTAAEMLAEIR